MPAVKVFREYYSRWKRRGAVAPSSRYLADVITSHVRPSDAVVEFGAGAGVFTRRLAEEIPDDRLHVVERVPDHKPTLLAITPNVYVTDALDFLASPPCDLHGFKAISGLPLLNLDLEFRESLLTGLLLEAGVASLRQFTYTPARLFTPDWLEEHGLHARRVRLVVRNLPPAFVWEYTRNERCASES